jgi:hypothetical protein
VVFDFVDRKSEISQRDVGFTLPRTKINSVEGEKNNVLCSHEKVSGERPDGKQDQRNNNTRL